MAIQSIEAVVPLRKRRSASALFGVDHYFDLGFYIGVQVQRDVELTCISDGSLAHNYFALGYFVPHLGECL
jgi:hypothetical protein